MIAGIICYRNGRIVLPEAGRPENPVEAGLAVTAIHRSVEPAYNVLWLEPAYVLGLVLYGAVDIAVLDRTGKVLRVHFGVVLRSSEASPVGLRYLMTAPIAIVARAGLLQDVVTTGMVLFWSWRSW